MEAFPLEKDLPCERPLLGSRALRSFRVSPETWARGVSPLWRLTLPTLEAFGSLPLDPGASRVSVVGTRRVSRRGRVSARDVARQLAGSGVVVVSGMARGVDRSVHQAVLDGGGATFGVLGEPIAHVLTSTDALVRRMVDNGLLLSSRRGEETVEPHHFLERNHWMAAMVDAAVIIEASERSGALHHVRAVLALGKPVYLHPMVLDEAGLRWPERLLAAGARVWDGTLG